VRERIKQNAYRFAQSLDRTRPFTTNELEQWGRALLERLGLEEKYLGFTMVLVGDFFWKEQFLATPFDRRMLLLPHCLKHAEGCPAEYDELGLNCEECGACAIADYKTRAEQLGYKVLVAEGTPIVLKLLVSGRIDAVLGVACLNVLEKAIDKVLLAGVPAYAIPLHSGDCKNTKLDESWVWEVLDQYQPRPAVETYSYLPLLRAANELFDEHFERLLPRARRNGQTDPFEPLIETERIAYEFLARGGKRFRPFVTLAAYDALRNSENPSEAREIPDHVRRTAMAIEAFHKASLVHDDIEDDDMFRYGETTLHRRYDTSTAINVGDYLIGLGYRLVSRDRIALGPDVAADIIDRLGDAHVKLCEGQGAELRWRQATDKSLKPIDAMKIYALKTAPAFEAALYGGVRLAGPADAYNDAIVGFCRHLGVGFQILNDLKDWSGDDHNKLVAGQDALAMRPTLLLALALDAATVEQRAELTHMLHHPTPGGGNGPVNRLREIFEACQVFLKAERLLEKSRERAEAIADGVQPDHFRQLLYFLVDTVLSPEPASPNNSNPDSPLTVVSIP
jgi:geranylgeranyl pyrophosphate synthase